MNKIGIHYAYWEHDWDADFVPSVARARHLGFDILEVHPGTVLRMRKTERDRLKGAAADYGIALTYCIGLPREYDIASPDRGARRKGIEFLKEQAETLRYMGAHGLSGILYGWWPTSLSEGENDKNLYLDQSIESMKEVVRIIEDYDIFFNLEVVNRFEQYLLNTAEEAVEYINRVKSDHLKILLDTFHMNIEEDSFEKAIITAGNMLGHFHVGETNRRPPGSGRMPWNEIMGALSKIGYKGAIVMEPFLMPGGAVGRDIRVYRDLLKGAGLDEEARAACAFIRSKVTEYST